MNNIEIQQMNLKTKLNEKYFGRWKAYLILINSDQEIYGRLTTGLSYQYYMNNNQSSVNLTYAAYVCSRYMQHMYE